MSISDILPERVIHKILSNLSFREAARMSILSKKWLQAWFTHPNLTILIPKDHVKFVDQIMERYRDSKIHIHSFKFIRVFRFYSGFNEFYEKWLGIALDNGVKEVEYEEHHHLSNYPPYTFPIFIVLPLKSLRILVLNNCHLPLHTTYSHDHIIKCHSLRKLTLLRVTLDDKMLQTLLTSYPLIVDFMMEYCTGFTKIELRNLQNIKSIYIRILSNERVVIHTAPTLECLTYIGNIRMSPMLEIFKCPNLKSLTLGCLACPCLSDGFIEGLLSRSQFLESLILEQVLGRYNIRGSESLKFLRIRCCEGSIKEIDVPNLVTLEYTGDERIPQLKFANASMKDSILIILGSHHDINYAWFDKLKKFLSKSSSWSEISLRLDGCYEEINTSELVDTCTYPPQVDNLNLNISFLPRDCSAFLDTLLWICRPKRLNLWTRTSVEMLTCFIDDLIYMKNSKSTLWRSQLKQVKAYRYDWARECFKHEELTSGDLAKRSLMKTDKILFLLDW